MKMYRVVTLIAAVLITAIFSWAFGQERVGKTEEHSIQSSVTVDNVAR